MRLAKLGIYPPTYLRDFYAQRPEVENQTYAEKHHALIDDCFGSSDFWTSAFEKLNYETIDIIANDKILQTSWAIENDFKSDDLFEIAAEQIKKFRPDVLLVADYATITAEFIRNIRRECASIRLILGWCGAPYKDLSVIREWDIALSCVPELVAGFRRENIRAFHINHAFAPRILDEIDTESAPNIDFAFIGSIVRQNQFHIEREKLLLELVKKTNLQIWSEINRPSFRQKSENSARRKAHEIVSAARTAGVSETILNNLPLVRKVANWDVPPISDQFVDERIAKRTRPPIFGVEMFQQLHNSRVVFNNHIDVSPVSASNMRLFETTGVGACLITDWKKNLPDLFAPDTEVLTYRTAAECAEKVKYILEHETERRAIAEAGQRRTLREHTFENRVAETDKIIRDFLKRSELRL